MTCCRRWAYATTTVLMLAVPPLARADIAAGRARFQQQCAVCHSLDQGVNKVGPSLFGVVGRRAGTAVGYKYSDAMKGANRTWNAATLDVYLTDPPTAVPGGRMRFPKVRDASQRAEIIAYLGSLK